MLSFQGFGANPISLELFFISTLSLKCKYQTRKKDEPRSKHEEDKLRKYQYSDTTVVVFFRERLKTMRRE